jgi:hypothetical protein
VTPTATHSSAGTSITHSDVAHASWWTELVSPFALVAALTSSSTLAAQPSPERATNAAPPPAAIASAPPVARGYAPVNGLRIYYEVPAGSSRWWRHSSTRTPGERGTTPTHLESKEVPPDYARMKTTMNVLGLAALLIAVPTAGSAQVQTHVSIGIGFPEPPPLVVVSPGIQVVPEYEEEVFFVNSWYWVRRDGSWYRTRDWHGGWAPVRRGWVPANLMRVPPGRYRHYYRDDDGRWRPHHPDEFRAWRERNRPDDRRAWWREHRNDQRLRREQESAWRGQQRADREHQRVDMQHRRDERVQRAPERPRGAQEVRPVRHEDRREDRGHDRDREHDRR